MTRLSSALVYSEENVTSTFNARGRDKIIRWRHYWYCANSVSHVRETRSIPGFSVFLSLNDPEIEIGQILFGISQHRRSKYRGFLNNNGVWYSTLIWRTFVRLKLNDSVTVLEKWIVRFSTLWTDFLPKIGCSTVPDCPQDCFTANQVT